MRATWLVLSALLTATLTACGGGGTAGDPGLPPSEGPKPTPKDLLALKNFSAANDCAEFRDYAAAALTEQYLQPFYRCLTPAAGAAILPCPVYMGGAEDGAGAPASGGAAGPPQPGRVSGTNTQEAGVDEADLVKADGAGNLYILAGKHLYVLDAFPPAGLADRPLATLDLSAGEPSFYADSFFLDEPARRLVVLGQSWASQSSRAVSAIVDVSDPANPVERSRVAVDGYGMEARRIGSRVHRVSRFDVPLPGWFFDANDPLNQSRIDYDEARARGDEDAMARIKAEVNAEISRRVQAAGAESLLPKTYGSGGAASLSCAQVARPEVPEGLGLVVIDSFDTSGGNRATSAAVNNAWMVYGSAANLYLAQSSFGWRWDAAQAEETAIYRFALSANGPATYQGVGKVPGTLSGAYAMSEHAGHLRVASTETRFTSTPESRTATTYNHLDVLRADVPGGDLDVAGAVHDFAQGERIQGVRFAGDRGYVVTFRQIDPLFAFDLSDPAHPAIASELKIAGFSSYLSPIGDGYLLTVGREGQEDGRLTGRMQISLFDARNLQDVTLVDQLVPADQPAQSWSYSAAEYDPHAFTYFPDDPQAPATGTLAVPLQTWDSQDPASQFAGFVVVRVDAATGLAEIGRVDHSALAADRFCDDGGGTAAGNDGSGESQPACEPGVYAADPRRAVFMQEQGGAIDLFSVSLVGVIASNAADPGEELGRKALPFDPPVYDYCCVVAGGGGGTAPPGG